MRRARLMSTLTDRSLVEVPATEAHGPFVLGLDVGTSSVRAALFDGRGREVAATQARVPRAFRTTRDGGAESDAAELIAQVETVIDAALARAPAVEIDALALACFWHSLSGVGADGRPLTPIYGWADTRAATEAAALRTRADERATHRRTGCRFHAGYWPAKLLWLRRGQPLVYESVTRWLSPGELLAQTFCGAATMSISMASGTGLFNQRLCAWDAETLALLDLPHEQLPPLAATGQTFKLNDDYARRWPRLRNTRIFPAVGDGAANNIGAGCVAGDAAALMIGTSGALRVLWAGGPPDELPDSLWCYRADERRVVVGGALSDGGGLYAWLTHALAFDVDAATVVTELAMMEPDAHGLTVLPFWAGERSTGWADDARGAITGFTLHTRPVEILRAAMEAVAYRFALIAAALAPLAPQMEIRASGGALAASPVWTQIIADVLGRPVQFANVAEASSRGAVLLALETLDASAALETVPPPPVTQIFTPDVAHHARYRAGLARQQQAYAAIIGRARDNG